MMKVNTTKYLYLSIPCILILFKGSEIVGPLCLSYLQRNNDNVSTVWVCYEYLGKMYFLISFLFLFIYDL